jgi:hypothetical protein
MAIYYSELEYLVRAAWVCVFVGNEPTRTMPVNLRF